MPDAWDGDSWVAPHWDGGVWVDANGVPLLDPHDGHPDGEGGGGTGTGLTVDTFQEYRLIMFANGDVRAVPIGATAPTAPTGLGVTALLSSVRVAWTAVAGAARYVIYRDDVGAIAENVVGVSFRDLNIETSATYQYWVQAVDGYGQRSPTAGPVSAFVDPALNVAPEIVVSGWPAVFPTDGRSILRVNAKDLNAQVLELALEADSGSVEATDDPSVWIYTP